MIALSRQNLGRFWANETGAAYRNDKLIHYGLKGSGDIAGILVGGKAIYIEAKTGKSRQSEKQKFFEQMVENLGGYYYVARDLENTLDFVYEAWKKENKKHR